jgi:hypothetical protein
MNAVDLTPPHGMRVSLELKGTAKESNWHTTLARIKVDGNRVTARCVVCGCHRLSLSPEIIHFLLATVAAYPEARNEIITISDGHYENSAPEIDHGTNSDVPRPGGRGQDDVGITLP